MQVQIRAAGFSITDAMRWHVERRLVFALARFAERIQSVTVRLGDINGPRGGIDKVCALSLRTLDGAVLGAEALDGDLYAAIDQASRRARRRLAEKAGRASRVPPSWRAA
jgi:putative sigma-54 modulation protein